MVVVSVVAIAAAATASVSILIRTLRQQLFKAATSILMDPMLAVNAECSEYSLLLPPPKDDDVSPAEDTGHYLRNLLMQHPQFINPVTSSHTSLETQPSTPPWITIDDSLASVGGNGEHLCAQQTMPGILMTIAHFTQDTHVFLPTYGSESSIFDGKQDGNISGFPLSQSLQAPDWPLLPQPPDQSCRQRLFSSALCLSTSDKISCNSSTGRWCSSVL